MALGFVMVVVSVVAPTVGELVSSTVPMSTTRAMDTASRLESLFPFGLAYPRDPLSKCLSVGQGG